MAIAGKTGTLTFDSESICAFNWAIDIETEVLDATSHCSHAGWREFKIGLKEATGSFGTYDRVEDSTGEIVLSNDAAGSVTITGDIIITNEGIANNVDGIQTFNYSFKFSEEPTIS